VTQLAPGELSARFFYWTSGHVHLNEKRPQLPEGRLGPPTSRFSSGLALGAGPESLESTLVDRAGSYSLCQFSRSVSDKDAAGIGMINGPSLGEALGPSFQYARPEN
jgi:hypothetical protein